MASASGTSSRTFLLLWSGQTVSALGDGLAILAIPLVVLDLTGQPLAAALAATPRTVGYLLAGFFAGPIIDRLDASRIMIVADVVRAVLFVAMTVLVVTGRAQVWTVLALAFAAAVAGVFFETGYTVVVQDVLPADALVAGNARIELSNQLSLLVGPALVGAIAAITSVSTALAVNAGSYVVSIGSLVALRSVSDRAVARRGRLLGDIRGVLHDLGTGLRYIAGHRLIRALATLQAGINFLLGAETLLIFFSRETLGFSPVVVGMVVSAGAAGGVAGTWLAGRLTRRLGGPGRLICLSVGVLGLALATVGAVSAAPLVALANLVIGTASIVATVHIRALRQQIVPREMLGRVSATARTLAVAANPGGAAACGALTAAVGGPRPTFIAAGVLGIVWTTLAYRYGLRPAETSETLDSAPPKEPPRRDQHP